MTNATRFEPPRKKTRRRLCGVMIGALLVLSTMGCAERGLDAPRIERLSAVDTIPAVPPNSVLRVATANLWGVSVLGFDWAERIDLRFAEFAERLSHNEPPIDVVMIQEAWKDGARRDLLAHPGLTQGFPHRVDAVDQPGGSGLVILSRFPIEATRFHRFRAQGNCFKFWEGDCLSGKGVLAIRIRFGERALWLGNTHLIACYAATNDATKDCDRRDPNGDVRWSQIVEARTFMESLTEDEPALLAGDFNLARTSRHYLGMTNSRIPLDPETSRTESPHKGTRFKDSAFAPRGWFESGGKDPIHSFNKGIDYIWTRAGSTDQWGRHGKTKTIFSEPVELPSGEQIPLSDHPVLALPLCLIPLDQSPGPRPCDLP
ncbi:MAG: endonuclease/exonuclease/phosphatase family protein [Myxococcota bacterium]